MLDKARNYLVVSNARIPKTFSSHEYRTFVRSRASQNNRIRRNTPWTKVNKSPNFSPAAFESTDLCRNRLFFCRGWNSSSPQASLLRRNSLFELPGNGFKWTLPFAQFQNNQNNGFKRAPSGQLLLGAYLCHHCLQEVEESATIKIINNCTQ